MSDTFMAVKALVDKADFEGLLKLGCPADEYDCESRVIEFKAHQFLKNKPEMNEAEFLAAFRPWLVRYWAVQFAYNVENYLEGAGDSWDPFIRAIYLCARRRAA